MLRHWIPLLLVLFTFACSSHAALNLAGLSPAAGTNHVCTDTLLRITFDAPPTFSNSGLIRIYTSAGVLVDTIDLSLNINKVNAPNVQTRKIGGANYYAYPIIVSGSTATIYPHAGVLVPNESYYVNITAGLFSNGSSGAFGGIADTNTWSFITKPANPPSGTNHLIVAADGSSDFCTVQGALDYIPTGNTPRLVEIRNGVYEEIVYHVSNKNYITYRGESRDGTIITYRNNENLNSGSSTRCLFRMRGDDVAMETLTLTNSTPDGGSQAEALRAEGRRFIFNHGTLVSYQDTLLLNSFGRYSYFYDSLIQGDTDYIWNDGIAVFQDCEIKTMNAGYTCQMRSEAPPYKGAVFLDCSFSKAYNFTGHYFARINPAGESLFSFVALVNCKLDTHIHPAGWLLTGGGATAGLRFWEYQSTDVTGSNPVNVGSRAAFSKQLNATEAAALRNLTNVYAPNSLWLPQLAPNIISQPQDVSMDAGGEVTFTVQATGIETANPAVAGDPSVIVPLSYQWLKSGTNLPGATNNSLSLTNAAIGDAGSYSVIVSNLSGTITSREATLTVTTPASPVIDTPVFSEGVFSLQFDGDAGHTYGVQCSSNLIDWLTVLTTNAPPLPYQWSNSNAVAPHQFYRVFVTP